MSDFVPNDCLDLNAPLNFIRRSDAERRAALIYFLKVGAISVFNQRVVLAQRVELDFVIDLNHADLFNACLWGTNLARADLTGALLEWADLRDADLSGANLSGARLMGADLQGANLSGANLTQADLRGANLTDARLYKADLTDTQQGKIPEILRRDNPQPRRKKEGAAASSREETRRSSILGENPGGVYAAPKRNYGSKRSISDSKEDSEEDRLKRAGELMEEQREKRKRDQAKFDQKKRLQKKSRAKKEYQKEQFLERKERDQAAFERKKREQEQFLERKREEEKRRK
jgi:hypothetical protein